jgi:hypothetical protein
VRWACSTSTENVVTLVPRRNEFFPTATAYKPVPRYNSSPLPHLSQASVLFTAPTRCDILTTMGKTGLWVLRGRSHSSGLPVLLLDSICHFKLIYDLFVNAFVWTPAVSNYMLWREVEVSHCLSVQWMDLGCLMTCLPHYLTMLSVRFISISLAIRHFQSSYHVTLHKLCLTKTLIKRIRN